MSLIMSFELSTAYRRSMEHFYGRFPEDNIWYLVYPFFKIFKYCGFAPVKLCLDKFPHVRFQPDRRSIFLSVGSFVCVLVGFSYGVYELSLYETLGFHKTATVISFIASWVQIFSLFILGCAAMVTSWINLTKMRNFIAKISSIDYALEMTGAVISYKVYRKRLLIQAGMAFFIPTVLSMVNCVMIKSPFTLSASCYWFICFAPMLSLTLKEIKFYNLMFLLKGKFNLVNKQIKKIGESKLLHSGAISVFHKTSDSVMLVRKDAKLTEQIRALADIYSNVVDCVDLVMELFSLHILMTTIISFAVVTIQSYNLFALIVHSLTMEIHEIVFTVLWIVIQILMIGVNVIACNLTSDAVSGCDSMYRRSLEHFCGRFPEDNIWYLVYPFFRVFKYCGLAPVNIYLDKFPHVRFQRDNKFVLLDLVAFIGITIGFGYGVHVLSQFESLGFHKASTVISFIASWVQIFSLFLLGASAVLTSWVNVSKLRNFIAMISHIDYALAMMGAPVSYKVQRRRLFIQAGVAIFIPTGLSMVNCIMIKRPFKLSVSCYWFICFAPMLALTLKELKFYNLMFLLRGKFIIINQEIKKIGESQLLKNGTMSVISKGTDSVLLVRKETKLKDQLRVLAEIYSNVVDCVDLVTKLFSLHMLLTTCTAFAAITIQSYNLFSLVVHSLVMQPHEVMFTVLWILVQIMMIGVNVIACNLTTNARNDVCRLNSLSVCYYACDIGRAPSSGETQLYSTCSSVTGTMSFELVTAYRRSVERFLGQFPENNIWFVAYPFFGIFKLCGFYPVKFGLDKYPDVVFYQDRKSCFLTMCAFIGITVGFGCGVHILSHFENLGLHKTATVISYITSWAQIFSLFLLGCTAVTTSWTNLRKMRNFFAKICQIDFALQMAGAEVSYREMRKKLFIQFGVSFVIPTCLSMVNCIMIKSPFTVSSSCYWFICFAPLLALTLKELQFYNLMFLLKRKFNIVNEQIAHLGEDRIAGSSSLSVLSKYSDEGVLLARRNNKRMEQMQMLADIFSDIADCVDVVLDIFSIHLLITTCTSFAVITIQSYNLFALIMHSLAMQIYEIVFTVAWIVVQIMVIGVNVVACSQTSHAMSDTGIYLHKLRPKEDCGMFLQMVQVFSLEILHRKKPLTAAGFFDMNFKLFTSIVAAVTTYLIIIIQFHLANLQLNMSKNQTHS